MGRGAGVAGVVAAAALLAGAAAAPLRAGEAPSGDAEKGRRQETATRFHALQRGIDSCRARLWRIEDQENDPKLGPIDKKILEARRKAVLEKMEAAKAESKAFLEREPWLRGTLQADGMVDDGERWVLREQVCAELIVLSGELEERLIRRADLLSLQEKEEQRRQVQGDTQQIVGTFNYPGKVSGPTGGKAAPPSLRDPPPPPPAPAPQDPAQAAENRRQIQELNADIAQRKARIAALSALERIREDMEERECAWVEDLGLWVK